MKISTYTILLILILTGTLSGLMHAALVYHYDFDEGTGVTAKSSINQSTNSDLALSNAGWDAGISGSAVKLNDNNSLVGAADPGSWALPSGSSITVAMWINLTGNNPGANPSLVGALSDGANGWAHHYMIRAAAGNKYGRGFVRDTGNVNTIQGTANDAATQIPINTWTHIAITLNVTDTSEPSLKYYLNGILKTTTVGTGWNGWGSADSLVFSGLGNPGGYTLSGLYDDLQIYDESLEADDISWLYNNPGQTLLSSQETATKPSPAGSSVEPDADLEWFSPAVGNPLEYKLYLRSGDAEFNSPSNLIDGVSILADNTILLNSNFGPLDYETDYFWRIDVVTDDKTITGNTWYFKTKAEPQTQSLPIDVYLFAGQSNMQGVGYSSQLSDDIKYQPEIMLYHTGSVSSGQPSNTWITLQPAGWNGFGAGGCFGPEIGFGLEITRRYPTGKIAFIKHAVGGTGISPDCSVSGWYPQYYPARPNADDQYVAFVTAVHTALTGLESMGYSPRIKGMLWMQGEEDAKLTSTGNDYSSNFALLISKVREEFSVPDMPVVYGQILPHCFADRFGSRHLVRQGQANVDQDSGHPHAVAGAFMVPTESLSVHSQLPGDPRPTDDVHFGTNGQLAMGRLFAQKFPMQFDFEVNGRVDFEDFAYLVERWQRDNCDWPDWCGNADITFDGQVNLDDILAFSSKWLLDDQSGRLVSHWPFDTDSTDRIGSNDAIFLNGAAVTTVAGEFNIGTGAISFDGIDDYATANSVCFDIAGRDVTLAMWIKSEMTDANVFFASINTANGNDNRLLLGHAASSSILSVYDNGWQHSEVSTFDGTWHHVALVLSDSNNQCYVYVDGVLEHSYETETSIADNDIFSLGQEYDAGLKTGDFFKGQIDDVRIYDFNLSAEQIKALQQI